MAREGILTSSSISSLQPGDRLELAPLAGDIYALPPNLQQLGEAVEFVDVFEGESIELREGETLAVPAASKKGPGTYWLEFQEPGRFRLVGDRAGSRRYRHGR